MLVIIAGIESRKRGGAEVRLPELGEELRGLVVGLGAETGAVEEILGMLELT